MCVCGAAAAADADERNARAEHELMVIYLDDLRRTYTIHIMMYMHAERSGVLLVWHHYDMRGTRRRQYLERRTPTADRGADRRRNCPTA